MTIDMRILSMSNANEFQYPNHSSAAESDGSNKPSINDYKCTNYQYSDILSAHKYTSSNISHKNANINSNTIPAGNSCIQSPHWDLDHSKRLNMPVHGDAKYNFNEEGSIIVNNGHIINTENRPDITPFLNDALPPETFEGPDLPEDIVYEAVSDTLNHCKSTVISKGKGLSNGINGVLPGIDEGETSNCKVVRSNMKITDTTQAAGTMSQEEGNKTNTAYNTNNFEKCDLKSIFGFKPTLKSKKLCGCTYRNKSLCTLHRCSVSNADVLQSSNKVEASTENYKKSSLLQFNTNDTSASNFIHLDYDISKQFHHSLCPCANRFFYRKNGHIPKFYNHSNTCLFASANIQNYILLRGKCCCFINSSYSQKFGQIRPCHCNISCSLQEKRNRPILKDIRKSWEEFSYWASLVQVLGKRPYNKLLKNNKIRLKFNNNLSHFYTSDSNSKIQLLFDGKLAPFSVSTDMDEDSTSQKCENAFSLDKESAINRVIDDSGLEYSSPMSKKMKYSQEIYSIDEKETEVSAASNNCEDCMENKLNGMKSKLCSGECTINNKQCSRHLVNSSDTSVKTCIAQSKDSSLNDIDNSLTRQSSRIKNKKLNGFISGPYSDDYLVEFPKAKTKRTIERHDYGNSPLWKFYEKRKMSQSDKFTSLVMTYCNLLGNSNNIDPWSNSEPPNYFDQDTLTVKEITEDMPGKPLFTVVSV